MTLQFEYEYWKYHVNLQRIFKILDDNNNGTLEIQEFRKGLCDFRVKIS